MKKQFFVMIMAISTLLVGCQYDDDYTPPNYVTFESEEMNISVLDSETETLDVTVYTANTTGADRSFDIMVSDDSTLDPSTYTLPATVTVPANSNEGTFSIEIVGAGIDNFGDELVLTLEETAELSAGNGLVIDVLKVCPFDINNFVGTYSATEVFTAGRNEGYSFGAANELDLQIELSPNEADESGNTLILTNSSGFYQFIPDNTVVAFDPETGNPSFVGDVTVFGYAFVGSSATMNTCAQIINLNGGLGNFGAYTVRFERIGDLPADGGDTDGGDTDGGDTDGGDTDGGDA